MNSKLQFIILGWLLLASIGLNAQALDLTLTWNGPSCFGASDGDVTLTATGGSGTYTYLQVDQLPPPHTIILNNGTNPVFTGYAAGVYFFQVDDGINIQTRQVTLQDPTPISFDLLQVNYNGYINRTGCPDLYSIKIDPEYGISPYTAEFYDGATLLHTQVTNSAVVINYDFAFGTLYTVTVTDACGDSETQNFSFDPVIQVDALNSTTICNTTDYLIGSGLLNNDGIIIDEIAAFGTGTITVSHNGGAHPDIVSSTVTTSPYYMTVNENDIIIGDNYTITYTDSCGTLVTLPYIFATLPSPDFDAIVIQKASCIDGYANLKINLRNGNGDIDETNSAGVTFTINSGPTSFTNIEGTTHTATYPKTIQGVDAYHVVGNYYLDFLPVGTYEIELSDGCYTETQTITINPTDVINYDLDFSVNLGCVGSHELQIDVIDADYINAIGNYIWLRVRDSGGTIIYSSFATSLTNGDVITIPNIGPGTYTMTLESGGFGSTDNDVFDASCDDQVQSITIAAVLQPAFDFLNGYICLNGDSTIESGASSGVPPYLYEIITSPGGLDNGTTSVTGIFTPLNGGPGTYTVRATDSCGNSSATDQSVEVQTFDFNITQTCGTDGGGNDTLTIDVAPLDGATYIFRDPLNNIVQSSTVNSYIINPYTPADAGTYSVEIQAIPCDLGTENFVVAADACTTDDFGDAPISYGDVSHTLPSTPVVYMGATAPDSEVAMQNSANADGDDTDGTDDEDSVTVLTYNQGVPVLVTIPVSEPIAGTANLTAWIDWNANGTFDVGEQVASDVKDGSAGDNDGTTNGSIQLSITPPCNAVIGTSYARFRFSSDAGLSFTGLAADGEVEDYQVTIICNNVAPGVTGSITTSTIEGCTIADAPAAETTVAGLEALTGDLLISDDCTSDANLTVSSSDTNTGTCPIVITRSYTITDDCGNVTGSIVHTVNIDDTTTPTFNEALPVDATVECDALIPAINTLTATDNCGTAVVAFNEVNNPGSCPGEYTLVRTWTATDDCGNTTVHTQTITVQDTTPPIIDIEASDINIECNANLSATRQNWYDTHGGASASDTCGNVTWSYQRINQVNNICLEVAQRTVEFIATDACGNSNSTIATFYIVDTIPPVFVEALPVDATIECGSVVPAAVTLTATDDCYIREPVIFNEVNNLGACPWEYSLVRTWTATDCIGNQTIHTQTITVVDTTAPTFTVPADLTIECDQDSTDLTLSGDVTDEADNCSTVLDATYADNIAAGACASESVITRTWVLVDDCGNTTAFDQTIIVVDTTAPTFTVPADLTIECDQDETDLTLSGDVTDETDNCSTVLDATYADSVVAGACASESVITRTWVLVDDCGNTTAFDQIITIVDTTAPTFTVPADLTIECDQDETNLTLSGDVTDEADNCSTGLDATYADSVAAGACANESIITRAWTLVDDCGNTTASDQIITIVDTTAPTFTVPADLTIECDQDETDLTLTGDVIDEADNCDTTLDATYADNVAAGACANESVITRAWTLVDDCGNTTASDQIITVVDTTAPTFTVPADLTIECDQDVTDLTLTGDVTDETDNCSTVLDATYVDSTAVGACANESVITRTWTLVDDCGNTTAFDQTITVVDTTPPTIDVAASDLTVECDGAGNSTDLLDWLNNIGNAIASDSCSSVSWSNNFNIPSDECGATGSVTVTFTAADDCGNMSSTTATFTIEDTTPPIIECPSDQTRIISQGETIYTTQLTEFDYLSLTDSCSTATAINNLNGTSTLDAYVFPLGDTTVVWTATDECGNIIECSFIVSVIRGDISLLKTSLPLTDTNGDGIIGGVDDEIIYVFTVENSGDVIVTNVVVTDPLVTVMGGPIASLNPGDIDATTFTATYIITQADVDAGSVFNSAIVNSDDPMGNGVDDISDDPNDPTDMDSEGDGEPDDPTITALDVTFDLGVTKSVDISQPVVGDQVTFTIILINEGNVTATNIELDEMLPSGYTYVSSQVTAGTYAHLNGTWTLPILSPGQAEILEIIAEVIGYGDYLNIATIVASEGGADDNPDNDEDEAEVEPVCLTIYNEFSPNNDGVNETFVIDCIENYPNNTLEVYNRWGNIVYKTCKYLNNWDGTSNGRATINQSDMLPVGTYYYVLDLGDGSKPKVGWLYINR